VNNIFASSGSHQKLLSIQR